MSQTYYSNTGTYGFESVVKALQAQIAASGQTPKEYDYSFEGITKAIQQLTFAATDNPGADIGPQPSGGEISIDENGNPQFIYHTVPEDGDLWFDTRQGRLFIAYQSQWYQTNGADGLAIITETSVNPDAQNLALGQTWFDITSGVYYIFAGTYNDGNGGTTTTPSATTTPIWIQIADTSVEQTTATLPLIIDDITPLIVEAVQNSNYLPVVDPNLITHQNDLNDYMMSSVILLDRELGKQVISIGTNPPENPRAGDLWFDSEDIELSIWYINPGSNNGQWVPTFNASTVDDNLTTVKTELSVETNARKAGDAQLQSNHDTLTGTVENNRIALQNSINALQSQINTIPSYDLSPYITEAQEQIHVTDLQNQLNTAKADITMIYSNFAIKGAIDSEIRDLQTQVDNCATDAELNAVSASIPSLTGYATETYVTQQLEAQPAGLTQAGGTLKGSIVIDKDDLADAALDYSTNDWDGRLAQKYQTYCPHTVDHFVSFGTNENMFEYNWAFDSDEDFCWTHSTNGKVASVDKNGIAATNFIVAQFQANTDTGRSLVNTIDVGDRLSTYQTALVNLRASAATATTLDELKTAIANALVIV